MASICYSVGWLSGLVLGKPNHITGIVTARYWTTLLATDTWLELGAYKPA